MHLVASRSMPPVGDRLLRSMAMCCSEELIEALPFDIIVHKPLPYHASFVDNEYGNLCDLTKSQRLCTMNQQALLGVIHCQAQE